MNELVEKIHRIYDRGGDADVLPFRIYPYIGNAFRQASSGQIRVLAIGINAYAVGDNYGKHSPQWFGEMFEKQMYRFQKGVWRDLQDFVERITSPPFFLEGLKFDGMDSIFLTNAVKVIMSDAEGRRADQLNAEHFRAHLDQWRDELDALAEADAIPHVIAVIGDPFWAYACDSFKKPPFRNIKVTSYRWCEGPSLHFANRIGLETSHGRTEVLLVRLRHPAGRTTTGSPAWLAAQADFVALAKQ